MRSPGALSIRNVGLVVHVVAVLLNDIFTASAAVLSVFSITFVSFAVSNSAFFGTMTSM